MVTDLPLQVLQDAGDLLLKDGAGHEAGGRQVGLHGQDVADAAAAGARGADLGSGTCGGGGRGGHGHSVPSVSLVPIHHIFY